MCVLGTERVSSIDGRQHETLPSRLGDRAERQAWKYHLVPACLSEHSRRPNMGNLPTVYMYLSNFRFRHPSRQDVLTTTQHLRAGISERHCHKLSSCLNEFEGCS